MIRLLTKKDPLLLEGIKRDAEGSWNPVTDMSKKESIILVAYKDNIAQGYIELEPLADKCIFVHALFVCKAFQRKMIAFRLTEAAKKLCAWAGIETLWWGVPKDNNRQTLNSYRYGSFFNEDDSHRYFYVKTGDPYVCPNRP